MTGTSAASRRIAAVSGHLNATSGESPSCLKSQGCAATAATLFARPAVDDVSYARPESVPSNGWTSTLQDAPRFARPAQDSIDIKLQLSPSEVPVKGLRAQGTVVDHSKSALAPKATFRQTTNFYHVEILLPTGSLARHLQLMLQGNTLQLRGVQASCAVDIAIKSRQERNGHFSGTGQLTCQDIHHRPFSAKWKLPTGVDTRNMMARQLGSRILITLPKRA